MAPPSPKPPAATATELDLAMMGRALDAAREAALVGEVPIGCVIYDPAGTVLATAHNLRETDADPTAHAEILALREAARRVGTWRLDGLSIAVTLEPCPMCAGALVNSRMARVVYGAPDPKMGCVDTLYELCTDSRFNHRLEVVPGVMADACVAVLREFFLARRGPGVRPPKPRPPRSG